MLDSRQVFDKCLRLTNSPVDRANGFFQPTLNMGGDEVTTGPIEWETHKTQIHHPKVVDLINKKKKKFLLE